MELQVIMIFFIHYNLFDQILSTEQNNNIALKIIPKYVLFPSINGISTYSSNKLRKGYEIFSPCHLLQRKLQKIGNDYENKYIDYFKLVVFDPSPKLTIQ